LEYLVLTKTNTQSEPSDATCPRAPFEQCLHRFVQRVESTIHYHIRVELCALKDTSTLPWFAVGDFNEALWQHEHLSICPRPENRMAAFRDALMVCELKDLGFEGLPFTYDNRRSAREDVKVCLDRGLADDRWRDIFSDAAGGALGFPMFRSLPFTCEASV
jgi:hypothetical protein